MVEETEDHWKTSHPNLCEHHHWGSPLQVTLAGLLGLNLPEGFPGRVDLSPTSLRGEI
jgi:hypothetical protein